MSKLPLPTSGGRYQRDKDGGLTPVTDADDDTATGAPATSKPKPVKKEG